MNPYYFLMALYVPFLTLFGYHTTSKENENGQSGKTATA